MKRLFFFFLIVGVLGIFPLKAQQITSRGAAYYLHQRGEVYFKFRDTNRDQTRQLGQFISLDKLKGDTVFAYANTKGFSHFLEDGIPYVVLTPPSTRWSREKLLSGTLKTTDDWNYYPSYDQYVTLMQNFQKNYPKLCKIVSIGKSAQGRALLFAHIGHVNDTVHVIPQFMYTSTMHGDETTGYILMLHLIDYMLNNYGRKAEITNLMDSVDIWINPLANPDGTYAGGNASVYGATRFNANHVDLNRNYPDPKAGDHPDGNVWQPETKAFMAFAEAHHFVLSCNMHTGSEVANYPWDTWSFRTADDAWWQEVCKQYADTVHTYARAGYMTALNNGITNGYSWYSITGGRQDYMNYFRHDREFTLELSHNKTPIPDSLPKYWEYNYRSLLDYLHQVLDGVRGIVTDSVSGKPLKAKIFVLNHDIHHSEVYSDTMNGRYFRPIYPGIYDFQFSAPGYKTKTISDIRTGAGKPVLLNVRLVSDEYANVGMQKAFQVFVYPNPAFDKLYCTGFMQNSTAIVMNLSGKVLFSRKVEPGSMLEIGQLPNGIYLLKIVSGEKIIKRKFIKR